MATVFKPKRSETGSSVPTTSNLAVGEMAVNTADQKIYVRDSADNIVVVADSAAGAGISDVVEDTTPQLGGDLDLNSNDITGAGNIAITGTSVSTPSITLTTTEDSSSAGPIIELKRNSASPADGDYLGQIKFQGENDADQEVLYAKITGKIGDASDGTEDGIIEFACKENGSNVINMRLTNNSLNLLNSTNLEVDGTVDGRDVAADGTKLDGIEASADVTDTTNVTSAGALMDSEVTNLAQVKAFSSADYATAAQGTTADSALQDVVDDTTPQLGGDLDLNSNDISGGGNITLSASTTESRAIEMGLGRTGNGYAFIDLVGDATYTDYGLRLIRNNTGANTTSQLKHRGTGALEIRTSDAANIDFYTSNVFDFRMAINGDFHADGDVIAYSTTTSDVRLKSDVEPITDALSKVNQLSGYTFTRNHNGQKSAGILAHELEKVLPEAVREKELPLQQDDGEMYKVVEYDAIHGLLIEAIKELNDKVERLEARLQIEDGLGNK